MAVTIGMHRSVAMMKGWARNLSLVRDKGLGADSKPFRRLVQGLFKGFIAPFQRSDPVGSQDKTEETVLG